MRKSFLLVFSSFMFAISINAQSVRTIKDPAGNDIILHKDSSYLNNVNGYLIMYALDKTTDTRNILVTNGDTSYWLLASGFNTVDTYSSFIKRKPNEIVFRGGEVWYISSQTPETTTVFYDNQDAGNPYEYLRIFEAGSVSFSINNLIIEAREKSSGDTVILYHTSADNVTTPFGTKLRIHKGGLPALGYSGQLMIASVFSESNQSWSEVGLYREFLKDLTLIFPLGVKLSYNLTYVSYFGNSLLVDHLDDETKRVYRYYSDTDTCIHITPTLFPGYTLLDFQNVKWTSYGFPQEPPLSYNNYFWKGRDQSNVIRYFVTGSLDDQEVLDLQNVANVDFLYSDWTQDSIYYYNYSNTQRGLMRAQIYNGGTKKDLTSIPFNSDFKLKGYLGKMYFGRYNPQSGKIEAAVKDFEPNTYSFLESTNGSRIETPTDFTFLDDKVFVHSRTTAGLKLVVYDPDGVVAAKNQPLNKTSVVVSPNPSSGQFSVGLSGIDFINKDISIIITNAQGLPVWKGEVNKTEHSVDLTGNPSGIYNLSLLSNETMLFTTTLIVICN